MVVTRERGERGREISAREREGRGPVFIREWLWEKSLRLGLRLGLVGCGYRGGA